MAAVTVNSEQMLLSPGMEVVNITTAADADTYVSRKLSRITNALFNPELNIAATDAFAVTFSARTATIQLAGTVAVTGTLTLFGNL